MAASRWCLAVAALVLAYCMSVSTTSSSQSSSTYDKGMRHSKNRYGNNDEDLIILRQILRDASIDDDDDDDKATGSERGVNDGNRRRIEKRLPSAAVAGNMPGKFGRDRLDKIGTSRNKWIDHFGGSSAETRFPLPERRQFPEVDWRGFNEDVFHESFGDFSPVKRWKKTKI